MVTQVQYDTKTEKKNDWNTTKINKLIKYG